MKKLFLPATVAVESMGDVPHWKNAAAKARNSGDMSKAKASDLKRVPIFRGFPAELLSYHKAKMKKQRIAQAAQQAIEAKRRAILDKFHETFEADRKARAAAQRTPQAPVEQEGVETPTPAEKPAVAKPKRIRKPKAVSQ